MVKLYKNIKSILKDKNIDLFGLGDFSYGTSELWSLRRTIIEYLANKHKHLDIFFEDIQPAIRNLNDLITKDNNVLFKNKYNGLDSYPMDNYLGHRRYDSIEFLSFIGMLIELNKRNNIIITIFGVDSPIKNNYIDLMQFDRAIDELYEKWPQFKIDRTEYGKYIKRQIKNNKLESDRFIAESIKYLIGKRGNVGLYLGHNQHVHPIKLDKFESAGHILKNKFKNRYISIGTASSQGYIKYDGEYKSDLKDNEVAMFVIYKKPKSFKFYDRGSLRSLMIRRYNNYLKKKNIVVINPEKSSLTYFSAGYLKTDDNDSRNYQPADNFDYIIYIGKTNASQNLIFESSVPDEVIMNYLDF